MTANPISINSDPDVGSGIALAAKELNTTLFTQTGSHLAQLNTVGFRAFFAKFNFVVVPKLSLSNLAT